MGAISGFFVTVLEGIFSFVGNYGWSIVLFTLLVRLVLLPLDIKSKKSMRAMSKIQPKMQELQRKYGKDKDKYNQKVQELYKREKVSPFSGCLPMLIQLPLLFAMFAAMRTLGNEYMVDLLLKLKEAVEGLGENYTPEMLMQLKDTFAANNLQSWLWIKNVFQPDSFMSTILPAANSTLSAVQVASGSSILTQENLDIVKAFLTTPAYKDIAALFGAADFSSIQLNFIFFAPTLTLPNSFSALFSSANGLFILPLFAAVSQFFMTKLTSPAQATENPDQPNPMNGGFMKWFFPLISLYFCASYNAAFAIYWTAANLIQMAQQYLVNLYFDRKDKQKALAEAEVDPKN